MKVWRLILLWSSCHYLIKIATVIILGGGYYLLFNLINDPLLDEVLHHVFVTVEDNLKIEGNSLSFTTTIDGGRVQVYYTIGSEEEKKNLQSSVDYYDVIEISCSLTTPSNEYDNDASFDYVRWLSEDKIYNVAFATEIYGIENGRRSIKNINWEGTRWVWNNMNSTAAPYVNALVFGDQNYLSSEKHDLYASTGVIHLFSISGMQVGLIAALSMFLLSLVRLRLRWALIVTMSIIPIYAVIAGANPPVVRASIMAEIFLLCRLLKLRVSILSVLMFSALMMLVMNPNLITSASFQLTVIVTGGIIWCGDLLRGRSWYVSGLIISLIAAIFAFPIVVNMNYEYNLLGVVMNLWCVPFVTFILTPLLLMQFLSDLIFGIEIFENLNSTLILMMDKILMFADKFTYVVGSMHSFMIILFYVVLVLGIKIWKKSQNLLNRYFWAQLLLIVLVMINFNILGKVVVFDVGQGDSIFVQLPMNQGNYLIDTGGEVIFKEKEDWQRKNGEMTVADEVISNIKYLGHSEIDHLIVTHGHYDHAGSAIKILEEFKVGVVYFGEKPFYEEIEREIATSAIDNGAEVEFVGAGDVVGEGSYELKILAPYGQFATNTNDGSIVFEADFGETWLFTGDAEEQVEEDLIASGVLNDVDILKVGHHGSSSSSSAEFINVIDPEVAIISAGEDNHYGHPAQETIDTFVKNDSEVLITIDEGSIEYIFMENFGMFLR